MKRPVAKISNHSRRLPTFASDVIDHSRRSPTFASRCFASSLNAPLVEDESVVWEKREETEAILNKFLTEALQLNPEQLKLTDLHRLPQHPIYKDKVKINCPIIFKVASVFDKHTIMTRLKMLKDYNERQQESCPTAPKVYVSEHLPKEMYEQKKLLMPHFKDARKMKLKTTWMVQNEEYCLFVDDKKVNI